METNQIQFVLEQRYVVAKVREINHALNPAERQQLGSLLNKIAKHRDSLGKAPLKCVVVEHDWPFYDETVSELANFAMSEKGNHEGEK